MDIFLSSLQPYSNLISIIKFHNQAYRKYCLRKCCWFQLFMRSYLIHSFNKESISKCHWNFCEVLNNLGASGEETCWNAVNEIRSSRIMSGSCLKGKSCFMWLFFLSLTVLPWVFAKKRVPYVILLYLLPVKKCSRIFYIHFFYSLFIIA